MLTPCELLTTTRAVRKRLDLDRPIPRELLLECVNMAVQAPNAGSGENWRFIIVDDPNLRAEIARIYRAARDEAHVRRSAAGMSLTAKQAKIRGAADFLQENLHRVPALMIPCVTAPPPGPEHWAQASWWGSILPATWSFMLAARSRGLGTAWTTVHTARHLEVAEILGLGENLTQAALIPVAYYTGTDFKPARRLPAEEVVCWNGASPADG